jgi:hypothetical protein
VARALEAVLGAVAPADPPLEEVDRGLLWAPVDALKSALATVDISVLDHLIVAGSTTVSFAERGWL